MRKVSCGRSHWGGAMCWLIVAFWPLGHLPAALFPQQRRDAAPGLAQTAARRSAARANVETGGAAGSTSVSFSRDLAKVLEQHCTSCHGSDQPRAGLSLASYQGLLRGGDNGPPVQPRQDAVSLLIRKLKGEADGQRMPLDAPPLADDVIRQFEMWIRAGAAFDGADPAQNVGELAAIARAREATHEQLRTEREKLALDNWRLAMPDDAPQQVKTEHFLLLGNVGDNRLSEYGLVAESLVPKITRALRSPDDQPFVKGAMTVYFFASSYDYGELGRMVERRDVAPGSRAHFRFSIVDAYAALAVAGLQDDALEAVLAEQITGVHVAAMGTSPSWFQQGMARAVAARLEPRSDVVARWNAQLAGALQRQQQADDFLTGSSLADDVGVLAFSFARFLMSDSRRLQSLLRALQDGVSFDAAFVQAYRADAKQLAPVWWNQAVTQQRRRGGRGP